MAFDYSAIPTEGAVIRSLFLNNATGFSPDAFRVVLVGQAYTQSHMMSMQAAAVQMLIGTSAHVIMGDYIQSSFGNEMHIAVSGYSSVPSGLSDYPSGCTVFVLATIDGTEKCIFGAVSRSAFTLSPGMHFMLSIEADNGMVRTSADFDAPVPQSLLPTLASSSIMSGIVTQSISDSSASMSEIPSSYAVREYVLSKVGSGTGTGTGTGSGSTSGSTVNHYITIPYYTYNSYIPGAVTTYPTSVSSMIRQGFCCFLRTNASTSLSANSVLALYESDGTTLCMSAVLDDDVESDALVMLVYDGTGTFQVLKKNSSESEPVTGQSESGTMQGLYARYTQMMSLSDEDIMEQYIGYVGTVENQDTTFSAEETVWMRNADGSYQNLGESYAELDDFAVIISVQDVAGESLDASLVEPVLIDNAGNLQVRFLSAMTCYRVIYGISRAVKSMTGYSAPSSGGSSNLETYTGYLNSDGSDTTGGGWLRILNGSWQELGRNTGQIGMNYSALWDSDHSAFTIIEAYDSSDNSVSIAGLSFNQVDGTGNPNLTNANGVTLNRVVYTVDTTNLGS